jgi:anti-sigma regulatory factor (Ser/Thr protein kinase)
MKQIIRLHVPCHIQFTKMVEDFMQSAMFHVYPNDERLRGKMCAVMNEVFVNIVRHSDTSKIDELVRLQIEIGAKSFLLSIFDYGPGIAIDGEFPPYPRELVGEKREFRRVIDGSVFLTVVSPYALSFHFEADEEAELDRLTELDELDGHGFGISIVTKVMDSLSYSYIGDGKFDWQMIKNLEEE